MSTNGEPLFEAFLNKHDDAAWGEVIQKLLPSIHEVDKAATQIWFYFYPLALFRALQQAEDPQALAKKLLLQGKYYLKDQIDSSHEFLYGTRFWPQVKAALTEYAASSSGPSSLDLATQIRELAASVASRSKVDESLLVGIAAVAFMTLQQVGAARFKASPGAIRKLPSKSPGQILKQRERDNSQGLFGFLKGENKTYDITFNENDSGGKFKLINSQHITTAAANDKRDYNSRDSRCVVGEGPIPVECRSAACGTCWVGVLGGAEKLSEVAALEWRKIKEFGYIYTDEPKPIIRLACQAQAHGAVSIVIPPWNGVVGRYLQGHKSLIEEAEMESER
ncbi:MAG TPA: 2Fe-2S iron-sulfur cluster-binding protein [Blastocatellia bacterium]|jgi:ferredoxin|nr:2Fe-2S iron-sulfur cluster-binding protein [Blastocatellia bacterium]